MSEEKTTMEPTSSTSDAASSPKRQTGTVAKWLNHRGIGFITPDGQTTEVGKDLLVHYSHIKQGNDTAFVSLLEGSKVEFETAEDPKNLNKLIAVKVTAVGGGECEKKQRHHRDDRYTYNKKHNNNNNGDKNGSGDGGGGGGKKKYYRKGKPGSGAEAPALTPPAAVTSQ